MTQLQTHSPDTTNTQPAQGFYIEASFDRVVRRERKNKDGEITVSYEVSVLVRTEQDTQIYRLKTKKPEVYKGMKNGHPLKVRVVPRAFKDFLYFTIVE